MFARIMKCKFALIIFMLSACTNVVSHQSITSTETITLNNPPTYTSTVTELTPLIATFSPTPIPNGFALYYDLWLKIMTGEVQCSEFVWEDVGLEANTGFVQPFIIKTEDLSPDSEILCSGYFIVPLEPGQGLFVYKDSRKGFQILPATYTRSDIEQNMSESSRIATPTPSQ